MQDRPATSHDHGDDRRRLGWALSITGLFMLVEVLGGLWSGSLALLADAGHMVTDTASLALAWVAAWLSERPAAAQRRYGHGRVQVLAAFVNALALIVIVGWIAVEAVQRLLAPRQIEGATMLGIALLGLCANLVVYRILHRGGNLNVEAARMHVLGDLFGSIAACAAAIVILATGWVPVDALLSLVVAALILRSAWPLLRRSTRILMEGAPQLPDVEALRAALLATVPGVRDVHDVHGWSLTSGRTMLTLHLSLHANADADVVLRSAKQVLAERFDVEHSAVQLEREHCPDAA